jgi:protein SCO1/2
MAFANPKIIPEFSVIDQNGDDFSNPQLQNRWSLMFFGFTNCPDVCPNTLSVMAELQNRVPDTKQAPQIILVTVDPMRDTPDVMQTYVHSFSDDIFGLSGELHNIQVLTDALGVAYAYNALPDGNYTVDHTAAVFIINPEGNYAGIYTGNLAAKDALDNLVHDYSIISANN